MRKLFFCVYFLLFVSVLFLLLNILKLEISNILRQWKFLQLSFQNGNLFLIRAWFSVLWIEWALCQKVSCHTWRANEGVLDHLSLSAIRRAAVRYLSVYSGKLTKVFIFAHLQYDIFSFLSVPFPSFSFLPPSLSFFPFLHKYLTLL